MFRLFPVFGNLNDAAMNIHESFLLRLNQFDSFLGFKLYKLNYLLIWQSYKRSVNTTNLKISQLYVAGKTLPVELMIKFCNGVFSLSEI